MNIDIVHMVSRYLNPQLTQRMPQEIIDKIDKFAKSRGITRNKAINDAVDFYADSKECILCGAVNNGNGKTCSCCGAKLYSEETIMETLGLMILRYTSQGYKDADENSGMYLGDFLKECFPADGFEYIKKYEKLGLKPQYNIVIKRKEGKAEYFAQLHFIADGVDVVPTDNPQPIQFTNEGVYKWLGIYEKMMNKGIFVSLEGKQKNKKSK